MVSDVPCAVVFVQKAILITEICLHDYSICGVRSQVGAVSSAYLNQQSKPETECSWQIRRTGS